MRLQVEFGQNECNLQRARVLLSPVLGLRPSAKKPDQKSK